MMTKHIWSSTALAAGLALFGCDSSKTVENKVEDLKEAQRASPEVARDLEQQLNDAKAEVIRLEEKLALARRGVTDDVVEEREELKGALQQQEQQVREEVNEAQRAAQNLNQNSKQAEQQLKRTQAPEVKAQVNTQTEVVPSGKQVEIKKEEKNIPIESARVTERKTEQTEQTERKMETDRKAKEAPPAETR